MKFIQKYNGYDIYTEVRDGLTFYVVCQAHLVINNEHINWRHMTKYIDKLDKQ